MYARERKINYSCFTVKYYAKEEVRSGHEFMLEEERWWDLRTRSSAFCYFVGAIYTNVSSVMNLVTISSQCICLSD